MSNCSRGPLLPSFLPMQRAGPLSPQTSLIMFVNTGKKNKDTRLLTGDRSEHQQQFSTQTLPVETLKERRNEQLPKQIR